MRKKAFLEAGMFDSEIQSSQDCDLWIRIVKNYRAVYIPEPLVNYYVSIESISKDTKKRIAGYDYLLKKYEKEYSENPETHVKRLNSIVGTFIFYARNVESVSDFNKYAYGYNSPAFEYGFVQKSLCGYVEEEVLNEMMNFQIKTTFDEDSMLFSKNVYDPQTLTARIYELTRYLDLCKEEK